MPRLFGWLPRRRWQRWLVLAGIGAFLLVVLLVALGVTAILLLRKPSVQEWVMVQMVSHQQRPPTHLPPAPMLTTEERERLVTNAVQARFAGEFFRATNIWDVHLKFTLNQWTRLGPNVVPPVAHFMQADGSVILRNPKSSRNGLAGVFGLDFPWSEADMEFGGAEFAKVGARFKGNGTYVTSQNGYKRPFKIDLSKHVKGQRIAGLTTLNFHNLVADVSGVRDAMAYEFFREAGVPAPRTAFARVRLTISGRVENRLLGLYVLVENPDAEWAREEFGVDGVALFKPVTYELFKDLGEDWKAYEGIYDPKTKLSARQTQRVIEFAKLVTHAADGEFGARVREFMDLDEFARFLACQVMLSNYDGILSDGQNFLLYLDPRTERFGFIPWDLDQSWGAFGLIGTVEERERASVWHPWIGENRFLERMLAAKPVQLRYRRELERLQATLFVPDRLSRRADELACVVRPFIAEESSRRLAKFERELAETPNEGGQQAGKAGAKRRSFAIKRFFAARSESVGEQLEGRAEGVVLKRRSGG